MLLRRESPISNASYRILTGNYRLAAYEASRQHISITYVSLLTTSQSTMHRYTLNNFNQLYLVVNLVVIDAVRAEQFPLVKIRRERELLPHSIAVYQEPLGSVARFPVRKVLTLQKTAR